MPTKTGIVDCEIVPVSANRDDRGSLYEIYRQSWPGAFPTVQWNACVSDAGVVRGAHVHVDFDEIYTLPRGRLIVGLSDIRRNSSTFGKSVQFEWADRDVCAVVIPRGVVHVALFEEDSVLAFGLSGYWCPEFDNVGCQWDAPEFGFDWPHKAVRRSERDIHSGTYDAMLEHFEERSQAWAAAGKVARPLGQ
ncbi:MAG TPA: dTDP-4-dehydrorhamnose 3,5-epimerase family protein [Pseudolabrys sp.]|jgi:dTDP-4-dehydrorhamnose 3,5-epimerase